VFLARGSQSRPANGGRTASAPTHIVSFHPVKEPETFAPVEPANYTDHFKLSKLFLFSFQLHPYHLPLSALNDSAGVKGWLL